MFDWILARYEGSLGWVLRHQFFTLAVALITMAATIYLYVLIPKGFFPQQDVGRLTGTIQADQDTSFQAMSRRAAQFVDIVKQDPAVETVVAYVGGGGGASALNSARMNVTAEGSLGTNAERRPGDRAPARQARAPARRHALPAGRSGSARRRPAVERAVSVHAARRRRRRAQRVGAEGLRQAAHDRATGRRQQRSADPRAAGLAGDRSQHRVAPGHYAPR